LRNVTTNALLYNNVSVNGTLFTVVQSRLTAGQQYRVAVASVIGSTQRWTERTFSVQSTNRTITFNAGTGATWASVPSGWTRASDTQLTRVVNAGVAWSTIAWPTAANLSRANHTPTIPTRPTGNVPATGGTVSWTTTWASIQRTLTFNAGTGATWATVPSGWTRASDMQLTRTVTAGVAWSTIAWPTAVNLSRANHTPTIPTRPTGNVPTTGGVVSWTPTWAQIQRTLTFNAGAGATWASVPSGWTRASDTQLTRVVNAGVAWSTIIWPTAVNLSRANHTATIPMRPTGNVPATGGTVSWTTTWVTTQRTTLVLIPGIKGSYLFHGSDRVWGPTDQEAIPRPWGSPFRNDMMPFLLSDENGVPLFNLNFPNNNYGVRDTYQTILRFLRNNANFPHNQYNVIFFTYDWRQSNAHNAAMLEQQLAGLDNVVLLAHSMGGLVASSYLQRSQANRNRVDMFITFGTPFMGATDAIAAIETGGHMGKVTQVAAGSLLMELSRNTTAVYELIPSPRYGSFIHTIDLIGTAHPPSIRTNVQGRDILATRTWAIRVNGTVKPMIASSTAFHNSLMIGGNHVANTVNSHYFFSDAHRTRDIAVYNAWDPGREYSLSHFLMTDGDETVTARSARNGRAANTFNTFRVPTGDHTTILNDPDTLARMRDLIRGARTTTHASEISEHQTLAEANNISSYLTLVTDGVISLDIFDSSGNQLTQMGDHLYRLTQLGNLERVGQVMLINYETTRVQYVLDSDEYVFKNIVVELGVQTEILVMNFENWQKTSMMVYQDIHLSSQMELHVSNSFSQLTDVGALIVMEPTVVVSQEVVQQWNAEVQRQKEE